MPGGAVVDLAGCHSKRRYTILITDRSRYELTTFIAHIEGGSRWRQKFIFGASYSQRESTLVSIPRQEYGVLPLRPTSLDLDISRGCGVENGKWHVATPTAPRFNQERQG